MTIGESTATITADKGGDGSSPPDHDDVVTVGDLFRKIYQFFYSKTVGLVLILAMTLLVFVGALPFFDQASSETYADPQLKAEFLEAMNDRFGGWAKVFDFLGFFHVFSSPLFLTVVALLGLSIIACTTHRIPQLWQRYRHPRTHVGRRFFDKARYRGSFEVETSADEAIDIVRAELKRQHYRVIDDERDPHAVYADRFGWGGFGTVAAHASFIVIIAAFILSQTTGIDETIAAPVGGVVEVGHGTNLTLEATSFEDTYGEDGRATDYVSHVILRDGEKVVAEQDIRVNSPLQYKGLKYRQSAFGIAADVTLTDEAGKTLYSGSVPLDRENGDGTASVGILELPDQGYEVFVFTPASGSVDSGLAPGQAYIRLVKADGDEAVADTTADQGTPVALGDYSVTFERERQYTLLGLRQDFGSLWMWIGSALLIGGMTVTFSCRHRRVWARVDDDDPRRVRFGSADKEDLGFERRFTSLVLGTAHVFQERKPGPAKTLAKKPVKTGDRKTSGGSS